MSDIDRYAAKQKVVAAIQQVMRLATSPDSLFDDWTRSKLLGSLLYQCNMNISILINSNKLQLKKIYADEFVLSTPSDFEIYTSMIRDIVGSALKRYQIESDEFLDKLEWYYSGCKLDDEGEIVEVSPDREGHSLPNWPTYLITQDVSVHELGPSNARIPEA
jgi:hypothetical protein